MADLDGALIGLDLENGWKIISKFIKDPAKKQTGGNFSHGYIVENKNGENAYLKILDLSRVSDEKDLAGALKILLDIFIYERDILFECRSHDRIIDVYEHGTINVEGVPFNRVEYIIFELADGDVRCQSDINEKFDAAWSMRALHNIATGLKQLHSEDIAHQDLKPSNVMVVNKDTKIGDLGHSEKKGSPSPRYTSLLLGDPTYAPPEHLYGYESSDFSKRRFGADAYLLGSMIIFFFTGTGMTPQVLSRLNEDHKPYNWNSEYSGVLPHLRIAFNEVINQIIPEIPEILQQDIDIIIRQLCDPDPDLRGDPKNRRIGANPFSMERFVTKFDVLAKKAEINLRR